jgi:hypothetical protein
MPPDSFESDQLMTAPDESGAQLESLTPEVAATAPLGARQSLFEMVCLRGLSRTEPPISR